MHTLSAPTRLTTERLIDWLRSNELRFFVDSDGDVGTFHLNRTYHFMQFGPNNEIFQVRGKWNRVISIERLPQVLEFCNTWNMNMIWPKAFYRVCDDGQITVFCEVSHDFSHGATDAQFSKVVSCGVHTGTQFFDELDQLIPDPAQARP